MGERAFGWVLKDVILHNHRSRVHGSKTYRVTPEVFMKWRKEVLEYVKHSKFAMNYSSE